MRWDHRTVDRVHIEFGLQKNICAIMVVHLAQDVLNNVIRMICNDQYLTVIFHNVCQQRRNGSPVAHPAVIQYEAFVRSECSECFHRSPIRRAYNIEIGRPLGEGTIRYVAERPPSTHLYYYLRTRARSDKPLRTCAC